MVQREPKENKMNLHINKMIECLIEGYKHAVIGFEFELKYRMCTKGLDDLLEVMDDTISDANKLKVKHHAEIRENRFLKAKLNGIIEDLVELREAASEKRKESLNRFKR